MYERGIKVLKTHKNDLRELSKVNLRFDLVQMRYIKIWEYRRKCKFGGKIWLIVRI